MTMVRVRHRIRQFWRHASARVDTNEQRNAEAILGPQLAPLFLRLPSNDQRHGLDVLATLKRLDPDADRLLQQAALLHDSGKGGVRFSVIDRSLAVFLRAISPRGLEAMLRIRPDFARRYAAYAQHAGAGAERLRLAGADQLAAIVAEHHAERPTLEATRRLQRADHEN